RPVDARIGNENHLACHQDISFLADMQTALGMRGMVSATPCPAPSLYRRWVLVVAPNQAVVPAREAVRRFASTCCARPLASASAARATPSWRSVTRSAASSAAAALART